MVEVQPVDRCRPEARLEPDAAALLKSAQPGLEWGPVTAVHSDCACGQKACDAQGVYVRRKWAYDAPDKLVSGDTAWRGHRCLFLSVPVRCRRRIGSSYRENSAQICVCESFETFSKLSRSRFMCLLPERGLAAASAHCSSQRRPLARRLLCIQGQRDQRIPQMLSQRAGA